MNKNLKNALLGAGYGAVAGGLLISTCFMLAGGGHGTYVPYMLFIPLPMYGAWMNEANTTAMIVWAALQYPIYGAVIGALLPKKWIGIVLILAAHSIGWYYVFSLYGTALGAM